MRYLHHVTLNSFSMQSQPPSFPVLPNMQDRVGSCFRARLANYIALVGCDNAWYSPSPGQLAVKSGGCFQHEMINVTRQEHKPSFRPTKHAKCSELVQKVGLTAAEPRMSFLERVGSQNMI